VEVLIVADRPTRFSADLLDAAAIEGARSSRSAKQQLDYWARLGRAVSSHQSAARRRIEAALADVRGLDALAPDERTVANAELDIAIERHAQSLAFGALVAAEGVAVVGLDEAGRLVQFEADGTSALLD
jgi:hypothetical protein